MVPDPAPPYEVGISQQIREHIERLSDLARTHGIAEAFDASVDRILEMLRMSPRESGDPLRRLRGLAMTYYRIYHDRLVVSYSVHDRVPMVVLWALTPGPGHPLAPPPNNGD